MEGELIGCTFAAAALIPLLIIKMIRAYLFTNSPSKPKIFLRMRREEMNGMDFARMCCLC
jgi:hypothetical protein